DGISVTKFKNDTAGRAVETSYFGVDGKPCLCRDGYSKCTRSCVGENDLESEIAYFGVDGKPRSCNQGYAKQVSRFQKERLIESAWFDRAGQAVLVDGKARVTYKHDAKGHVVETCYLGTHGELFAQPGGMARSNSKFDDRGRNIDEAYFDPHGKPANCADGYSRVVRKYETDYLVVEEAYYGVDGKPVQCKNGYARWAGQHGDTGQKSYFDAAGKPVAVRPRIKHLHDDPSARSAGLKIGDVILSCDGKPVEGSEAFYALRENVGPLRGKH